MQAIDSAPNGDSKFKVNLGTVQIVQAVQPLRSIHHGDEPVPDVSIVQPRALRSNGVWRNMEGSDVIFAIRENL